MGCGCGKRRVQRRSNTTPVQVKQPAAVQRATTVKRADRTTAAKSYQSPTIKRTNV